MSGSNAVFGLVIFNHEVGGVELEALEEGIGWFLGPLHEVKVIVDVWSVSVNKALGDQLVHGLWWALGLDYETLFRFQEWVAAVVFGCPWSVVGEAGRTQVVSLAAFAGLAWLRVASPWCGWPQAIGST